MCNINLIFKKDMVSDKKLAKYMNVVSCYSFQSNDDGEGFVAFDESVIRMGRSLKKLRYGLPSWFLMTHQRKITSGKGVVNSHPHETKDLILVHNGSFYSLGDDEKSDSSYYLDKLQEFYEEDRNLTKAIRSISKEVRGTYSIVVIEKSSGKVFYYKESVTKMFVVSDRDYFIMSTSEQNIKFAKFWFRIKKKVREVEELYIYDVLDKFRKVRKFDEGYGYSSSSSNYGGYGSYSTPNYGSYGSSKSKKKKKEKKKTYSGFNGYGYGGYGYGRMGEDYGDGYDDKVGEQQKLIGKGVRALDEK